MRNFALAAGLLAVLAAPGFAQQYRKHNVTLGMGAALPKADLEDAYANSFLLNVAYGYRFHPWFQADVGFDTVWRAARVRDFFDSEVFGRLRIRDFQHFVPFGGRVVVPLGDEKVLLYAGGGGVYMRYREAIRQPFGNQGFNIDCWVCGARDGWGSYGQAGVNVFVDRARNFRVGVNTKVIRGHTEGDPLGAIGPNRTRDQWVNVTGEVGFSF